MDTADWLGREDKVVLKERLGNIITKDGWILVKSDKTRSRALNEADAVQKMTMMINEALKPPEPKFTEEELEKIRRGKVKANKERLKNKKIRGDTKKDRGGPSI